MQREVGKGDNPCYANSLTIDIHETTGKCVFFVVVIFKNLSVHLFQQWIKDNIHVFFCIYYKQKGTDI